MLGLCRRASHWSGVSPPLQMAWFARLYQLMLVWLAKAHAIVDPIKERMRAAIAHAYRPIRRRVRRWLWMMQPGRPARFLRRLARLRRRAYAQPAE